VERDTFLIAFAALVTSILLTGVARKLALSRGVLDVPNERSSHSTPTPRGGGISIVLAATAALVVLAGLGALDIDLLIALAGGGMGVAAIGFIDDRRPTSAGIRLAVHFAAALWALVWLGGLPPLRVGDHIIAFGWEGYAFAALGIVWTLNLFNFMDGIDGLAGSEAVFVACAGALLAVISGASSDVTVVSLVFAAACCGFLFWNWPPAKIFMGDVGSGYVGYSIAVLAIAAARDNPVALLVWLILGGIFFVDATVTFVRRLGRGERVYEAHRSHAYQYLARRWESHKRVTVIVSLVNVLWLLPWAFVAMLKPTYAAWVVCGALAPLILGVVAVGAGRRETPTR
jgi:Fuc2NAc and GlcNAc transferase